MGNKKNLDKLEADKKLMVLMFDEMRKGLVTIKAMKKVGLTRHAFDWLMHNNAELAAMYARAKEDQLDTIAQEIMDISDAPIELTPDGKKDWQAVQMRRLQVDSRKWLLSKMAPKKYGDRVEIAGDQDNPLLIGKIERIIVDKQ